MEDNIIYSNIQSKPALGCVCCSESRGGIASYGPPQSGQDCGSGTTATGTIQEDCDSEGGTLFLVEDSNFPPICQEI
jgi:hypothetical protein